MRKKTTAFFRTLGVVVAAALVIAGCRTPFPVAGLARAAAGSQADPGGATREAGPGRHAQIVLKIKWPERDFRGFRAAAIPQSTNTLVVKVRGPGRPDLTEAISRPAGSAAQPVSHSLVVREGAGLTVEVKAYREDASSLAGAIPIAQGAVAGLNARAGERVTVPLTLTATFTPRITALSFGGSPTLQTLTLTGENFPTGDIPARVTFDGVAAAPGDIERISSASMKVRIPANARTGPLIVEADGIPSTGDTIFWVMKNDLPNSPKIRVTYGEGATSISLRTGQEADLTVQESIQYLFQGSKTEADFPEYAASKPVRTWIVSDTGVAQMTGDRLRALAVGSATVKARIGWVESNPVDVAVSASLRIDTIAGSGGRSADLATSAGLSQPYGIAVGAGGDLLLSEWGNQRIRIVKGGGISTLAGAGLPGWIDEASASARFRFPAGLALGNGYLYVADRNNHAIRKVALDTGSVSTVVGNGTFGFEGDGRPASEGRLNFPEGICLTRSGDLVIADTFNQKIRIVSAETGFRYGQAMEAGKIYTLAGPIKEPEEGFQDNPTWSGARFKYPSGVAAAGDGTIFVADAENACVRMIAPDGAVTTVAGNGQSGSDGDGGPAVEARLARPVAVAVGPNGKIFVADRESRRVRAFVVGGNIETVAGDGTPGTAGDGGPATAASLVEPTGLAVTDDALYIVDQGSDRIRRVGLSGGGAGTISTPVENAGTNSVDARLLPLKNPSGTTLGRNGLLVVDSANHVVRQVDLPTGQATILAGIGSAGFSPPGDGVDPRQIRLNDPLWAIYDSSGNLYVSDAGNRRVRVVPAASGTLFGVTVTAGYVATVAGGGDTFVEGAAAAGNRVYRPGGLAFDRDGHLLIADTGSHRVVRVNRATGRMTTVAGTGNPGYGGDDSEAVAAQLDTPTGLAVLPDGAILIADSLNHRIRRVDPESAKITTAAGGGTDTAYGENVPASKAQLNVPTDIVPDFSGGFYFTDKLNHVVRRVTAAGTIVTVAGKPGEAGFAGDGGPALDAQLNLPFGLAIDQAGSLYVTDSGNGRVRRLTAD